MPWRRQLGNVADTYLKYYLTNKNNASESDRIGLRQRELAQQNRDSIEQQAEVNRKFELIKQALANPAVAMALGASGQHNIDGVNLDTIPTAYDTRASQDATRKLGERGAEKAQDQDFAWSEIPIATERERSTTEAKGLAENSVANTTLPDVINRTNQTETGTRAAKVTTAGQTSRAQAAGAQAVSEPQAITTDDGTVVWRKFNPTTRQMEDVPGPPTQKAPPGQTRKLLATEVAQLSDINTAEVEGVKLLQYLKQNGLDKSNDPLDPRWNNFLATKLKMAGSPDAGDAQQRTAFVQAVALRGLMQGRPSKYMAELFGQHLPSGKMTGQKLYQVLNDVLQQGSERRQELGSLTGAGIKEPVSGQTFSQWQKILADEAAKQQAQTPVQLPGQPKPTVNTDGLKPSIQQLLSR
jgi:hypothetical protein